MIASVDGKKRKLRFRGSVLQLMQKLGLSREEHIVKVNGKLATDDEKVGEGDKVEIIKVVYGG
ncbi:MAG: MoaD/ThiS family protein [Candidatus Anstonellales archaeon]